ncbi:hypothetical protein ADUPG1_003085, partial [Aduncisulcus paluster]
AISYGGIFSSLTGNFATSSLASPSDCDTCSDSLAWFEASVSSDALLESLLEALLEASALAGSFSGSASVPSTAFESSV